MNYFTNGSELAKGHYQLPGIGYYMNGNGATGSQATTAILPLAPSSMSVAAADDQGLHNGQFAMVGGNMNPNGAVVTSGRRASGRGQQSGMTGQKRKHSQDNGQLLQSSKDPRMADPFSPECTIPLPFQLGDEYSYYGPTAIWKRNERERHRVRCVNDGYDRLRIHLPMQDKEKRLSKVETLRFAIRYIHHLEKLLADARHENDCDCDFVVRSSSAPSSDNAIRASSDDADD